MPSTDLRQALRALRRAPWYSLTAVGVIALGMGLATTVFTVVDGVLFKPVGLPQSNQLFTVVPGFRGLPTPRGEVISASERDLLDWSAAAPDVVFTGFRAQPYGGFGTGVNDDTAGVATVQPNVFDVLNVRPLFGGFSAADFASPQLMQPVIATYDVWQSRFGGDPTIIGREIEIDLARHAGFRIVGVMPRGFIFPTERADVKFLTPYVFTPSNRPPLDPRRRSFPEVLARVPAGAGVASVQARIEQGMKTTASVFPALGEKPAGWSEAGWRREGPFDQATIEPLAVSLGSASRPLFSAVFFAAVVLVALSALNVSGLMVARTFDRARELAVRRALGASTWAVARLTLAESLVLVSTGSLLGLAATSPLLGVTVSLLPEEVVLLKPPTIDWRVSTFVIAGAVLLTTAAAIWPIRRSLRSSGSSGFADAGRASARTRSLGRFVVISLQVAGGFVLTLGGALLVGSLLRVYANVLPIRTDNVLLIEAFVQGPGGTLRKSLERNARVDPIVDRLRRVPGVGAVAVTSAEILRGGSWGSRFTPPEGALKLLSTDIDLQAVTSDYFQVTRPHLVAGRLPTPEELAQNARVLVVSERLAQAYWPGASALGRPLVESDNPEPYTVVGVVQDVRWYSWDTETASIYGPYDLLSRAPLLTILMEVRGSAGQVTVDALAALHEADPLAPPHRAAMLDDLFVDSVRPRRFQSWLFGSFAAAGLTIVGAGMLGLLAMATARREREMGIRHALGATPPGLVGLVVREQLRPVVAGLVFGGLIAMWAAPFVARYLYQITIRDPRIWAVSTILIVAAAAIGTLVPAVRASRTDPVVALRAE